MTNYNNIQNIIETLSEHADSSSVAVLERLGTNCSDDEVRRMTARALIQRNTSDALSLVINHRGKGINDLNTGVAMSAINDLLALENKEEALKVLDEAILNHSEQEIRETAASVKTLMTFS